MRVLPTPRQKQALDFIIGYVREHGYAPTHRELASALGSHVAAAHFIIHGLAKRGHLKVMRRSNRGIALIEKSDAA